MPRLLNRRFSDRRHATERTLRPSRYGRLGSPEVRPPAVGNRAAIVLAVIAVMTLLHFTRPVALPVALAIFGFLLLNPLVERIARTGIPRAVAVIAIQLALLAALASLVVATADPLVDWFKGLPQDLRAVRADLLEFRRPFAEAQESAKIIGELSELGEDDSYKVEVAQPNWLETLLERGPTMLLTLAVAGFLTLLLLLTAPRSVEALYAAPIAAGTRRRLAVCIGRAQRDVSTYLGWLVLINAVLGAVVALVMAVLDLNNPLMWGLMAGVANFVPYVGPLAVLVMIWIAGVVQFDSVLAGTWPALTFLVLTSLEGQLVTPAVLGRHLALPPPLIFVAILVLGWSWGLFGAFLAVPALVTGKAVLTYWPSRSMSDARRAARAARHREPVAEDAEQSSSVPTP